jgi:hypothetical protein
MTEAGSRLNQQQALAAIRRQDRTGTACPDSYRSPAPPT